MTTRLARAALADLISTLGGVTCVPQPPRQVASAPAVFFAALRKQRFAQGGVDALTITLLAVVDNPEEFAFDELDDLTDRIDTLFDATRSFGDADQFDLVPTDDDWLIGLHEIGGQGLFGAMLDVQVHY